METPPPALVLRADAGHGLGSGHVMRLAALAEAASGRGARVRVMVGGEPDASVSSLARRGLAAAGLFAETGGELDREAVTAAARELGATTVVIDGPGFHPAYTAELAGAGLRVVSVDDLGASPLPTPIVINHNLGAESLAARYPAARLRLLGRRFHLLRHEFRALPPAGAPVRALADRVLVTMGGSDPVGATARILRVMPGTGLDVLAVLGPGFRCDRALTGALADAEHRGHRVSVHYSPRNLATLMSSCDAAISSGGGTLAELAYLGRPTLALAIVDDQVGNARRHAEAGLVSGGRPITSYDDAALSAAIAALIRDRTLRRDLRDRASAEVDGRGAERVLSELQLAA